MSAGRDRPNHHDVGMHAQAVPVTRYTRLCMELRGSTRGAARGSTAVTGPRWATTQDLQKEKWLHAPTCVHTAVLVMCDTCTVKHA